MIVVHRSAVRREGGTEFGLRLAAIFPFSIAWGPTPTPDALARWCSRVSRTGRRRHAPRGFTSSARVPRYIWRRGRSATAGTDPSASGRGPRARAQTADDPRVQAEVDAPRAAASRAAREVSSHRHPQSSVDADLE